MMKGYLKKNYPKNNYTLSDLKHARNLIMSVSPYLGKIVVIGVHYKDDNNKVQTDALFGNDEREILINFWKYLSQFGKGLFISFNGLAFDVPFIIKRSMYHRITPSNNSFLDLRRFSKWPHFDVKMVVGDWDRYAVGTLDLLTNFLGIPSPKDGKVAAADVNQAYLDGKLKDVADYCLKDVIATYEVYSVVKNFTYNQFKK